MTTQTTTQTASLSAINPLIAHDEWSEDTASNVRDTLSFLADAIPAVAAGVGFNKHTANGVGLILEGCVAAMKVKNA